MKNLIIPAFLTLFVLGSCSTEDQTNDTSVINQNLTTLSQEEIDDLLFLREEEKLARDVYLFSYDKYQASIFNNIAQSEQSHMDSVLNLLNLYGIEDSASTERGIFNNADLQDLYNTLTKQSDISLIEALKIGATIEDLDINDIDDFIVNTNKTNILAVYDNLTCGSKNHLRSYINQLTNNQITYEPQFISVDYFTTILSESSGSCNN